MVGPCGRIFGWKLSLRVDLDWIWRPDCWMALLLRGNGIAIEELVCFEASMLLS